ncbi:MAG: outer membrane protein assembly factor BamE [Sneathiella sp.]|nr:outer membrane protein assembly factor BamE [Sneathiella sp.]
MNKILIYTLCASALVITLTACDPVKLEKGYRIDPEMIQKIEPGVATKETIIETLGSPSSVSTFPGSGEAWYYITKKTEHFAFLEKKVTEQKVIVIQFDENEVVKGIKNYDKDDGREINIVGRTTPTGGNELGFFEQIFGNFGRFNPGAN